MRDYYSIRQDIVELVQNEVYSFLANVDIREYINMEDLRDKVAEATDSVISDAVSDMVDDVVDETVSDTVSDIFDNN